MELFQKYFNFLSPNLILKNLYNINDTERNNAFVDMIKRMKLKLKGHIKLDIVEKILDFNS